MSGCTESWWCVTRVLASRHLLLRVSTLCQLPPAQRSDLALEKVTRASHSHQPRDAGLPPACPCHVSIQRFVIFFSEFMGWHHHRLVLRLSAKNDYKPKPDTVIDLTKRECVDPCIQKLLSLRCWWRARGWRRPGRVPGCATCHHRSPPLASPRTRVVTLHLQYFI